MIPILSGTDAVVAQACVVVPNLEAAIAAHLDIAESGTFSVWTYDQDFFETSKYRGVATGYSARIAINDRRPQLEYVELMTGPSVFHEHLDQHGYGLHHIGYLAEDVDEITMRMQSAGYPAIQTHTGWGLDHDGQAAFFDTRSVLGYWTEVVRPPARRRTPDAIYPPQPPPQDDGDARRHDG